MGFFFFFFFQFWKFSAGVNFFLGPAVPWSRGFCRPAYREKRGKEERENMERRKIWKGKGGKLVLLSDFKRGSLGESKTKKGINGWEWVEKRGSIWPCILHLSPIFCECPLQYFLMSLVKHIIKENPFIPLRKKKKKKIIIIIIIIYEC